MKITISNFFCLIAAIGVLAFSGVAVAQNDKAANLDQLLQMVKDSKIGESAEHRKRESEFNRQKNNQAGLLKQAENTKAAEERRSTALEEKYKEQELLVQQKREQLDERLGSLKELFGHLTSTAGDLRSNIENISIVSAQYPGREDFLAELIDKMNSETQLPSIEEIERLWSEQLTEIVESSKVVKFNAEVSDSAGNKTTQEVVRIGNFNLVSNGAYLDYKSDSNTLSKFDSLPQGGMSASATSLQSAGSGFTKVFIDPSGANGGDLLKALVTNTPSLAERFEQGRLVGKVIAGVGLFALLIGLWRFFVLMAISGKVGSQLKSQSANTNNPLGRVLKVAEDNPGIDVESLELKLEEAVLKERPPIEGYLNIIKIISMVAPLLGLLGTVTGMIVTFQAITIYGAGDPKAMAGGISGALVTTVLGLIVAIPTVLMHTFLNGKAKSVVQVLDEQSAGIIAAKAER